MGATFPGALTGVTSDQQVRRTLNPPGVSAPAIVRYVGDTAGQRWPIRSLVDTVLRADGTDELATLTGAFNRVSGGGLVCELGSGTFGYMGLLPTLTAGSLIGDGANSIFSALDPYNSAICIAGVGQTLKGFRGQSPNASGRITTDQSNFIRIGYTDDVNYSAVRCSQFLLQDIKCTKMGDVAFLFRQAQDGRVVDCDAYNTYADGTHVETNSSQIEFIGCKAMNTGDDGFAVVSLVPNGFICSDIRFVACESWNSSARGFAVVGGMRVTHHGCKVYASADAAIYKASESSYNTYGCLDCHDFDTEAYGCMANATSNHGILFFGGRAGTAVAAGVPVPLTTADCGSHRPYVRGCGAASTVRGGVGIDPYAIRTVVDGGRFFDLLSTASTPNMLENSGQDSEFRDNYGNNIGGVPLNVGAPALGRTLDRNNRTVKPRVGGSGSAGGRYAQPTSGHVLISETCDVQTAGGGTTTAVQTLGLPGSVILRRMTQDGLMQPEIDPERDGWSYSTTASTYVPVGYLLDLTQGTSPRNFVVPGGLSAGQSVTVKTTETQEWLVQWLMERDNNQYYMWREQWRATSGFHGNGTAGVDYIATDSGSNAYNRIKASASYLTADNNNGTWGSISMTNDGNGNIFVTFTPASGATTQTKFAASFVGG